MKNLIAYLEEWLYLSGSHLQSGNMELIQLINAAGYLKWR